MFTIKEVAPSRSKSAFWQNDIKVARAIKKGNRKIDIDVIKAGLQDAIQKEELARQATGEGRTSGVDNHPVSPKRHGHHHHHHNNRTINNARNVNFNLNAIQSVDESVMEELFGSVGSADISALLDDHDDRQDQATESLRNMSRFPFFWQTY
jgi:hypothetical protein